ncbi:hypothetical protein CBF34_06660 [Vagococcus penaei]|uniref:Uncharacterized protein n=1 Tax=Vagococcus penaei TaxID=633807 RepID=A0A1Q2D6G6_9ENTE|nr:DUF924 family protein [Vagococcus penaei]AQP54036.1 hypothetical protein BW732_07285 [Vagococcus penaei]RSU01731.1 hypothetical protein CBF34_06660 [Vagococcus penaei]
MQQPADVLTFWFKDATPEQRFKKDIAFDQQIRQQFFETHQALAKCEGANWRQTIHGRLAEIIVLDQFSRNMFRQTPQAFAYDSLALILAQEAVATQQTEQLTTDELAFLLMPYMHSESPIIHQEAVKLFASPGLESYLDFEIQHKTIIDRFGRYPHRNVILGRLSTVEELAFLGTPNSSF